MLDANQRRDLERILRDLKEVQASLCITDAYTYQIRVREGVEDAEGYVGEAIGAVALALGRHTP